MIARTKSNRPNARQAHFLQLLPLIQKMAQQAFQDYGAEEREELIAQVVANCWAAFVDLMDRGKEDVIYATPLARYAIRRVRAGRSLGRKQNMRDVSSPHAQQQLGVHLDRLDQYHRRSNRWRQILVEDRRAGPADTAASRIDFADWLRRLPDTLRAVAELLGAGETTGTAAREFKLSNGRVSQMRRELKNRWEQFHAGAPA